MRVVHAAWLAAAVCVMPLRVDAGQQGTTLAGAPSGTTNETNPVVQVFNASAGSYKYSINGSPYSVEVPIQTPISFTADVDFGGRRFAAGSRELADFINARAASEFDGAFTSAFTVANVHAPLQITYLLNRMRAAVAPENVLNLSGAAVNALEVELIEAVTPPARYELTRLTVSGGELERAPDGTLAHRFLLKLAPAAASIEVTAWVNNSLTAVSINDAEAASGVAVHVPRPSDGSIILVRTAGPDGSQVDYEIQVTSDTSLPDGTYRGFYLRAFNPSSSFIRIQNPTAASVSYSLSLNGRLGSNRQQLLREITQMPPAYAGEPLHRKAWRFVRDNRFHFEPLTPARWYHAPALFFNSAGFGFCDDAAAVFYYLVTGLGYSARVWDLNGHVVTEVRVNERWEMFDPDQEVYYTNRQGLIAGVAELASDSALITDPLDPLAVETGAYSPLIAAIYASQADNTVQTWLDDPASVLELPMVFTIPAGAVFEFPGIYDVPPDAIDHRSVSSYANARLFVPPGSSGTIDVPLIVHSIGWSNAPVLSVIARSMSGDWASSAATATWTVDAKAPFTAATQPGGYYTADQPLTLSASEPAVIYYTKDSGAALEQFVAYSAPILVGPGEVVRYFAVDQVGNREQVRVYGPPVKAASLAVTSSTITTATFTASASGSTGSYEFMYSLWDPLRGWTVVRPYGSDPAWTWDHAGAAQATYIVLVRVRNTGAASTYEALASMQFAVASPPVAPLLANPGDQVNTDGSRSYAETVLAASPVAYFRFGETEGGVAADSAGSGAATIEGDVTLGQTGATADGNGAFRFNGTTGRVLVSPVNTSLAGDLTIELWVNVSLGTRQTLISKNYLGEFELTLEPAGELNLYQGDGSNWQNCYTSAGAVAPGAWQHVVVTRDAATRTVRFYVNGALKGSSSYSLVPSPGPIPVAIGRSASGRPVDGSLDEVALYARVLSVAEIASHYVMRAANGTGKPVELQLVGSDRDGLRLTFSATGLPPGLAIDAATGLISGVLTSSSVGRHDVTAAVSNGAYSTVQTFAWTVTHDNRPPVLTRPADQVTDENAPVSLQVDATDADGDALAFSAIGLPAGVTINSATGRISGTPTYTSAGGYAVTVSVSDGSLSCGATFAWSVRDKNRAPVLLQPGDRVSADAWNYGQAVVADGAGAYWHLAEGIGSSGADTIGGNTATRMGAVAVGQAGALMDGTAAMLFDGVSGYLSVPNPPALPLSADLSIELWVNVSLQTRQTLISKHYRGEFELTLESNGQLNLYQGNGTSYAGMLSAPRAVRANVWQHVVVTRSAATRMVRFYVNGVASGGGTTSIVPVATTNAIVIGRSAAGVQYVNGRIDEVALYPVVLSPAQISAHYNLAAALDAPTAVQLQLLASDADGDALTYAATGLPPSLTLNAATGLISGTLGGPGVFTVTATATDGRISAPQTFTWTVTHVHHAPVVSRPADQAIDEGTAVSLRLSATDADGDALVYLASGLPAGLTMDATGRISGAPSYASAGTYNVIVTVTDGTMPGTTAFGWTVRDTDRPPTLVNPGDQVTADVWSYPHAVVADGARAYWRLADGTGTAAADAIGLNAATRLGGVGVGQAGALADGSAAMSFDGLSGYLSVPNPSALNLSGDLSIELWVNVSLERRQTLISKHYRGEFELTLETNGQLNLYQGNGTTYAGMLSIARAVRANVWQHIVVTRSAATGAIRFYVNGVASGGGTASIVAVPTANAIVIGRSAAGVQYVNGRIDEAALYATALSPAQVSAHYDLAAAGEIPTAISLQLAASDPDGDAVSYTVSGLPPSLTLNPETGLISGTVSSDGTYPVTITATARGLTATQSFNWTVTHVRYP